MKLFFRPLPALVSERGSVIILVAVAAMMLIVSTGVAVDMARAQVLQTRIQSALDAAGLAAGATANSIDIQTQAQKYFSANFPTGYLGSGTVTVTASISGDQSTVSLTASTVQATTFLKAIGINSVNVGSTSQVTRAMSGMELTLVLDNTGSMNSPVNSADSSTSKIQALQSAITSSGGLLDSIYGVNVDTVPNLWVGVVPFSQAVNIGTGHTSWYTASSLDFGPALNGNSCQTYTQTSPATNGVYSNTNKCSYTLSGASTTNFGPAQWAGCVLARSGTTVSPTNSTLDLDGSDDVPSASVPGTGFQVYNYPATADNTSYGSFNFNPWVTSSTTTKNGNTTTTTVYNYSNGGLSVAMGPNVFCPQPLTDMTASRSNIVSAVNAMAAAGDTAIPLGMAWGYRMLSPNWQGLWGGEMNNTGNTQFPQLPLPYNTTLMNKVIVLMTDGMNTFTPGNYLAYGYLNNGQLGTTKSIYKNDPYNGSAEQAMDNHTLAICNALKNNGVIIYTIGFGTTDDDDYTNPTSVNGTLLKGCATQNYAGDTSHYFLAPTNAQLASAFQQIGSALSNLRVSQ